MIELLLILATWRITSLLVNEDGPYKLFAFLRDTYGYSCFWCVSVWVAIPFALYFHSWIYWLSFSAGAILVEEVVNRLQND